MLGLNGLMHRDMPFNTIVVFFCFCFCCFFFFCEPKQNQGRGLFDRKLVQDPSNFIAARPNASLLFWFFGALRCGIW